MAAIEKTCRYPPLGENGETVSATEEEEEMSTLSYTAKDITVLEGLEPVT